MRFDTREMGAGRAGRATVRGRITGAAACQASGASFRSIASEAVSPGGLGRFLRMNEKGAEFFEGVIGYVGVVPNDAIDGITSGGVDVLLGNGAEKRFVVAREMLADASRDERVGNRERGRG